MLRRSIFAPLLLVLIAVAPAAEPEPVQQGRGHPFACTDYVQGKVFLISAEGHIEWEYPAPRCDDLWVLPNGNLLFNIEKGVREVTRDKRVVFAYDSASEVFGCQRLPNGNTFIAERNGGRLLEVASSGKIVKELHLLPSGKDGGHYYLRNARQLANGNYLVPHYGMEVVREYDPTGKLIMEIPATGGPHSVVRLPDGNTLVSCGDIGKDRAKVFEVDRFGNVVWQVGSDDLPGIRLWLMTGMQRLPNGNTVMANYLGHGQFGKAPHLIEVTPDKKVVWTFSDHKRVKTIASVQLLDVPGDATKGEILH
jgi:hypothetical protein